MFTIGYILVAIAGSSEGSGGEERWCASRAEDGGGLDSVGCEKSLVDGGLS